MVSTTASTQRARSWGAGTAAVVRLLIAADRPLSGVALAEAVGVSQPRASQILRLLRDAVRSTKDGYLGRRAQLLDLYRQRARPALVEPESYWYSTRPMAEQAAQLVKLGQGLGARLALSADLAVDLLVPWRHPTLTIVYCDVDLFRDTTRFVPAQGRGDASMILRWTSDPTLLRPFSRWPDTVDDIPLADPTQQWSDLLDLGGTDRGEAADRLRRAILERWIQVDDA